MAYLIQLPLYETTPPASLTSSSANISSKALGCLAAINLVISTIKFCGCFSFKKRQNPQRVMCFATLIGFAVVMFISEIIEDSFSHEWHFDVLWMLFWLLASYEIELFKCYDKSSAVAENFEQKVIAILAYLILVGLFVGILYSSPFDLSTKILPYFILGEYLSLSFGYVRLYHHTSIEIRQEVSAHALLCLLIAILALAFAVTSCVYEIDIIWFTWVFLTALNSSNVPFIFLRFLHRNHNTLCIDSENQQPMGSASSFVAISKEKLPNVVSEYERSLTPHNSPVLGGRQYIRDGFGMRLSEGFDCTLYTLLNLSNLEGSDGQLILKTVDECFRLDEVLSIEELPDTSWELAVRKSYIPQLKIFLQLKFPNCHIEALDPTEPKKYSGRYPWAKISQTDEFRERATRMVKTAHPKAVSFYAYLVERMDSGLDLLDIQ